MIKSNELISYDAIGLADLIHKKEIKPIELLEITIERIEKINSKLNAIIYKMYDRAKSEINDDIINTPFAGIPFLIKDLAFYYKGAPLTFGSNFYKNTISDHDSELAIRYKKSGLIILGITNTSEFGLLPTTENRRYGNTLNPWDTRRSPGGSSGGAAASISSGIVPMAHGNDGGGSLRIPASCCGLFGLKPTRARTPNGPDKGDIMSGLAVSHAITKTVRDSAMLLDLTCGYDIGAPYYAPAPQKPYIEEINKKPDKLKIAYTFNTPKNFSVDMDCKNALNDAIKLCEEMGHELHEVKLNYDYDLMNNSLMTIWTATLAGIDREDLIEPLTWGFVKIGKKKTANDYLISLEILQKISRNFSKLFIDYDVLLTPTLTKKPVLINELNYNETDTSKMISIIDEYLYFVKIANVTGQPAMSVPLFWNYEGLPIGVQFIGRYGDESTLFRLAFQLETARPWKNKIPNIHV